MRGTFSDFTRYCDKYSKPENVNNNANKNKKNLQKRFYLKLIYTEISEIKNELDNLQDGQV